MLWYICWIHFYPFKFLWDTWNALFHGILWQTQSIEHTGQNWPLPDKVLRYQISIFVFTKKTKHWQTNTVLQNRCHLPLFFLTVYLSSPPPPAEHRVSTHWRSLYSSRNLQEHFAWCIPPGGSQGPECENFLVYLPAEKTGITWGTAEKQLCSCICSI